MKKYLLAGAMIGSVALLNACHKQESVPTNNNGGTAYLDLPNSTFRYYNDSANGRFNARATLGRVLFYDTHLSVNNATSCASCHKQQAAFADNVAFSRGFENKLTGRNSPSIQNLVVQQHGGGTNADPIRDMSNGVPLFWDGRENSLVDLIARPISNHVEMGLDVSTLPGKLEVLPYYKDLFKAAYGTDDITIDRISSSVAYFVGSISGSGSRFDAYQQGNGALSALEMQGKNLFNSKYQCGNCHHFNPGGYMPSGFMDIGLDEKYTDLGRGAIERGIPQANGTFKVPNLRSVALTAPYMHDGRFKTLSDVIDHYSKGINNTPNLSEELKDQYGHPMKMNISEQEKTALVAFLNTLTDNSVVSDAKYANPFKVK